MCRGGRSRREMVRNIYDYFKQHAKETIVMVLAALEQILALTGCDRPDYLP